MEVKKIVKKTNEKNGSFHLNVWKKKFNDDDEYHMATKYYHHSSWIMAYHTLENNTDNDMHTHTSIHHLSDDDHHVFFVFGYMILNIYVCVCVCIIDDDH